MDSIDILNGNFSKENENVNIVEESEFSKLLYAYLEMESDISELYGIFKKIGNFVNGLDISNKFRKNIFNELFSGLLFNDYVTPLIDQQQPVKDKLSEKYHIDEIDVFKLTPALLIRAYEYSKKSEYSLIIGENGTPFSNLYYFIVKNSGMNYSIVNTPDKLLNVSYNDCEGIFIVISKIEQYDATELKKSLAELNNGKNRFIFTSTCDLDLLENKGYLELPEIKNSEDCIYKLPTFSNFLKNMDNLNSLIKWEMRGCSRYGLDENKILERFKVNTNNFNEFINYDWPGNFEQFETVVKEYITTGSICWPPNDIKYRKKKEQSQISGTNDSSLNNKSKPVSNSDSPILKIKKWSDLVITVKDPVNFEFYSKSSRKKIEYTSEQLGFSNTKKDGKLKVSYAFFLAYCLHCYPELKSRIKLTKDNEKNYRREINNLFRKLFGLDTAPFPKEQPTQIIEIKDNTKKDDFENRHSVSFNDNLKYNLEDCDNLDDSSSDSFY